MSGLRKNYWQGERWIWLAFGLVVVFLVTQVSWWMIFQRHLIQQSVDYAQTTWLREAAVVQQLWLASDPESRARLAQELRQQFPHLQVEGERVFVNPDQLAAYRNQQLRSLRMLAFEGPFFLLVMLLGLWLIARSLRREQEFKRRQQNFLLSTTHEFRTPIGTLRLLLETLQVREVSPEKRRAYLLSMGQELSRLEDLSERLLATARLEQGLASTQTQRQDLNQAVAEKVQTLKPTLEARGAALHFEPAPQALFAELDAEALRLVLSNLLENALKYSPAAHKPIWVRVEAQGNQALVQVEDRGIGIAKEALPNIFEPFFRAGNELTRETRGMGLGLYLVKSLMELMGGKVVCEPMSQGTRFTLYFPISEVRPALAAEGSPA